MKRLLSTLLSLSVLCTSLTAVNTDDFALIPGSSFQMGDALDGLINAPVVTVNVSAFYMGQYEVTKAEWDEVRTWGLSNGYTDLPSGSGKAADHPVHSINWYAMVKWCNARSEQEGRTPCYTVSGSTYRTGSSDEVVCDWTANGYRLPTEAEWEKAARGGLTGQRFPWGDTISHANANYSESTSYSYDVGDGSGFHPDYSSGATPYTSPVGSFAANGYGLYDMTGNVWEWCWDWYAGSYSDGAADPRGASSGSYRVLRGGSWDYDANVCQVAVRLSYIPSIYVSYVIGFRVALSFDATTDTDGDGLDDSVETNTGVYISEMDTGTDPNNADTDNDGVPDGAEVNTHSSNPLASDSSGDGLSDGFVVSAGFAPNTDYSALLTGGYSLSQLEDARSEGVTAGIQSVTSDPQSYQLYSESNILEMNVSNPTLSMLNETQQAQVEFTLETSTDLEEWAIEERIQRTVQATGDKFFVRISSGAPYVTPTVVVFNHPSYGEILTDQDGNVLYGFSIDSAGGDPLYSGSNWPLASHSTDPEPDADVTAALTRGTFSNTSGGPWLKINDRPVYTYVGDSEPNQASGHGLGFGLWFTIKADGSLNQ